MNLQDLTEALAVVIDEQREGERVEMRLGGDECPEIELHLIVCGSRIVDALLDHGFAVEVTKFDGVRVAKPADAGAV